MELCFVVEDENGKDMVMNFDKDQLNELLNQLTRLTPLVNCFG